MECESPASSQSRMHELSFLNKSGNRSVWSDLERRGSPPGHSTLEGPRPGAHNPATYDMTPQQMAPISMDATRTGSMDLALPGYSQPLPTHASAQPVPPHTSAPAFPIPPPPGYINAPTFPIVLAPSSTSNLSGADGGQRRMQLTTRGKLARAESPAGVQHTLTSDVCACFTAQG